MESQFIKLQNKGSSWHVEFTKLFENTNCMDVIFKWYQQVCFIKKVLSSLVTFNVAHMKNVSFYVQKALDVPKG
jgi:hypothetical protein